MRVSSTAKVTFQRGQFPGPIWAWLLRKVKAEPNYVFIDLMRNSLAHRQLLFLCYWHLNWVQSGKKF